HFGRRSQGSGRLLHFLQAEQRGDDDEKGGEAEQHGDEQGHQGRSLLLSLTRPKARPSSSANSEWSRARRRSRSRSLAGEVVERLRAAAGCTASEERRAARKATTARSSPATRMASGPSHMRAVKPWAGGVSKMLSP